MKMNCTVCGTHIETMAFRGTDYCSDTCRKKDEESKDAKPAVRVNPNNET